MQKTDRKKELMLKVLTSVPRCDKFQSLMRPGFTSHIRLQPWSEAQPSSREGWFLRNASQCLTEIEIIFNQQQRFKG